MPVKGDAGSRERAISGKPYQTYTEGGNVAKMRPGYQIEEATCAEWQFGVSLRYNRHTGVPPNLLGRELMHKRPMLCL